MKALVEWLNSDTAKELDSVIEAGIAHYEFVRIHPFVDGNERTARVLATLILYLRGFDAKQFFCLDDYYDSNRQAYYRALQSVNQETLDLTIWLEYFVEGVNISIETVKYRVIRLSSERLRTKRKVQTALIEKPLSRPLNRDAISVVVKIYSKKLTLLSNNVKFKTTALQN